MKPDLKSFADYGTDPKEVEELLSKVKESVTLKDEELRGWWPGRWGPFGSWAWRG